MGKRVHSDVLDGALDLVRSNATKIVACSGEPASFSAADGSLKLAEVTVGTSDLTLGDAAGSGRRVTVAQKSGVTVAATGTANHVALLDVANSRVLYVTTCTPQSLTLGQNITFGSWTVDINDPV